jgi:hypothetical protein
MSEQPKAPKGPKQIAPGVVLPHYTLADVQSLQMLAAGTAEAEQQKRALKWILDQACMTQQWAYQQQPRETDVALGRQLVGQMIYGLLKLNVAALRRE